MPECRPRMDTKKCYGEFCVKGGKPAERLAKLACEKSVKVPTGKPTVLYQDIAGYKKDYELQLYLSQGPDFTRWCRCVRAAMRYISCTSGNARKHGRRAPRSSKSYDPPMFTGS